MKKLKITPLNVIAALALAFLVVSFFQMKPSRELDFSVIYKIILVGMLVVAFITDMIFRFIFKDLKRIWFVEIAFISLTVIIFLILQK